MQSTGDPSSAKESAIRIRGINDAPLLVINGVPRFGTTTSDGEMRLSDLNPDDIESVTILKDAASAAVYGARAANGVILVQTKKGKDGGKVNINYRGQYNLQQATQMPDFLDAYDFALLFNKAVENTPGTTVVPYTPEQLEMIRTNAARHDKKLWSALGDGEDLIAVNAETSEKECEFITAMIRQKMGENPDLKYDDFAILYRSNHLSRELESALRQADIPYTLVGGQDFYNRKEIKDAAAYLKLLVNERDSQRFLRILLQQCFQILTFLMSIQYFSHTASHNIRNKRLCNKVICTKAQTLSFCHRIGICCQKNNWNTLPFILFFYSFCSLFSIHFRHLNVHQYQIRQFLFQIFQSLRAGICHCQFVFLHQGMLCQNTIHIIVINYQYFLHVLNSPYNDLFAIFFCQLYHLVIQRHYFPMMFQNIADIFFRILILSNTFSGHFQTQALL